MTRERRSDDQTPIALAAEINAIIFNRQQIQQIEEQRREKERQERLEAELRQARWKEESKRKALEDNKRLREIVQHIGIREIFGGAHSALVRHYPSAIIIEGWGRDIDKTASLHQITMSNKEGRYDKYRIRLAWNTADVKPIDPFHDPYYYVEADYNDGGHALAVKGKKALHKFGENEWQNLEELKRAVLECIADPAWQSAREPYTYSPYRPQSTNNERGGL